MSANPVRLYWAKNQQCVVVIKYNEIFLISTTSISRISMLQFSTYHVKHLRLMLNGNKSV